MTTLIESIHQFENKFEKKAERFAFHHQYLAFFALFFGMPILTLTALAAGFTAFVFPLFMLFGWI